MTQQHWKGAFTAGEVTPLLWGRPDLQRYATGAEALTNWIVHPHGGASPRGGTAFVAYTRGARPAALVPFTFNEAQSYVLEFGSQYIRFFKDRAPLVGPTLSPDTTLTLSGTTGVVTATAGAALFDPVRKPSLGTAVVAGVGRAIVTDVLSTTQVQLLVVVNFTGTYWASGLWARTGNPVEVATPYSDNDVPQLRYAQSADTLFVCHPNHAPRKLVRLSDTSWTFAVAGFNPEPSLEQGDSPGTTLALSAASGTITATAGVPYFLAADVGRVVSAKGGAGVVTAINTPDQVVLDVLTAFPATSFAASEWKLEGSPLAAIWTDVKQPKGAVATITSTAEAFRTNDVGRYVVGLGGLGRITSYLATSAVKVQIINPFARVGSEEANQDPAGAWTLEDPAWSDANGYPGVVCFHEQRLWFFSTRANPLTGWASATADFINFGAGANDDNAITFTIAAARPNLIRWAKPAENLIVGTYGAEFRLHGGDRPLTPTNLLVAPVTNVGSAFDVDALALNNVVLFVDRSARKIREWNYDANSGLYQAPDLGILSEHLFREALTSLCAVRTPDTYVLATTADGRLLCCAYDRLEQVVGWTPFSTAGAFRGATSIPTANGDEVWVVVERAGKHCVEHFDGKLTMDSLVAYEGAPAASVRGLYHLEGRAVKVLEDSVRVEDKTVATGAVAILPSSKIRVGLPYPLLLRTLRPNSDSARGTTQGLKKRAREVLLRLLCPQALYVNPASVADTSGPQSFLVNGEDLAATGQIGRVAPGVSASGDYYVEALLGWDRAGRVTLTTTQPIKGTLVGVRIALDGED